MSRQNSFLRGMVLQNIIHTSHHSMEEKTREEPNSLASRALNDIPANSSLATTSPPLSNDLSSTSTSRKDTPITTFHYSRVDTIVTCILMVLIVLLSINLAVLLYKPIRRYLRRRYRNLDHVQQKRKERRYHTIDQWLVTKVRFDQCLICFDLDLSRSDV
jgi:ABC-type multidrug transport system fused ATPase/permease subunit